MSRQSEPVDFFLYHLDTQMIAASPFAAPILETPASRT
jgi:hypothetical protein